MQRKHYEDMSREELLECVRAMEDATGARGIDVHRDALRSHSESLDATRRRLEEARDRYRDLYDFAPVAYVTLDGAGLVREMNLTATVLFGAARASIQGQPLLSWIAFEHRPLFLQHMRRCRREGVPVTTDLDLQSRDGTPIAHVELHTCPALDGQGTPAYHTAVLDLTERDRAEKERNQREQERQRRLTEQREARAASEAKDRFLAILSHELRTPLTAVLLAVQELRISAALPITLRERINRIERNIEIEARLIDDMLDLSRIAQGKLQLREQSIDLHAVLSSVLDVCAPEMDLAGISVNLRLEADMAWVRGDRTRLIQVFWNLVRNAIDHGADGDRIEVRTERKGDRIAVSVSDAGPGMSPAELERLFEPFEQARPTGSRHGGLGLGLSIARGLVEQHDGLIYGEPGPSGKGTTFVVELPLGEDVNAAVTEAPRASRAPDRPVRVLLAEDHQDTAELLQVLLEGFGYGVHVAHDIESALAASEQEDFDVLVSDVGLPDGSGHDLLRRLRARRPIPAVALTGFAFDDDVRAAQEAGFGAHVTKPTTAEHLCEAIEAVRLEHARPEAGQITSPVPLRPLQKSSATIPSSMSQRSGGTRR